MNAHKKPAFASPSMLRGHAISLIAMTDVPALRETCAANEITTIDVVMEAGLTKSNLLHAFVTGMHYPEPAEFGYNWDAFEDAINDLSWLSGSGFAVIFRTLDVEAKSDPEDLHMLREILTQAHVNWAEAEIPFRTYVVETPKA